MLYTDEGHSYPVSIGIKKVSHSQVLLINTLNLLSAGVGASVRAEVLAVC